MNYNNAGKIKQNNNYICLFVCVLATICGILQFINGSALSQIICCCCYCSWYCYWNRIKARNCACNTRCRNATSFFEFLSLFLISFFNTFYMVLIICLPTCNLIFLLNAPFYFYWTLRSYLLKLFIFLFPHMPPVSYKRVSFLMPQNTLFRFLFLVLDLTQMNYFKCLIFAWST